MAARRAMAALGLVAGAMPLGLSLVPGASPAQALAPPSLEERVEQATVTLLPSRCAGAVVEDGAHVATVAHCVQGRERVRIRFHDGREVGATVRWTDPDRDHALLALDAPAAVAPLPIAEGTPAPGDRLYFGSRPERPTPPQSIRVEKIARCPSLPGVEGAIFTDLDARPGDSGSPLVDEAGALAGMVHGGARCRISTPAAGLDEVLPPAG